MVKQLFLPLIAVALFIIAVGVFTQKSGSLNFGQMIAPNTKTLKEVTVGSKTIKVEIANTASTRSKGLSGRASLPNDTGMLFVFEDKSTVPTFWMKDMLIPLDIIWIKEGKIIKIDENVPAPAKGTSDTKLQTYSPGKQIDFVLEVNAGFSKNNNIKAGDSVELPTL